MTLPTAEQAEAIKSYTSWFALCYMNGQYDLVDKEGTFIIKGADGSSRPTVEQFSLYFNRWHFGIKYRGKDFEAYDMRRWATSGAPCSELVNLIDRLIIVE